MEIFAMLVAVLALVTIVVLKNRENNLYGNKRYCYKCKLIMEATHCVTCKNIPTNPFRGFDKIKDHPV